MIVLEKKCVIWKITNGEIVEIRIGNEVFGKKYIIDTLPVLKEKHVVKDQIDWNKYTETAKLQENIRDHEKRAGEKHVATPAYDASAFDKTEIIKPKEQKPEETKKTYKRKRVKAVGSGRRTLLETHLDNHPDMTGFTIKQIKNTIPYYRENDRNSERLDRIISSMIATKRIFQVGKDKFKVAMK